MQAFAMLVEVSEQLYSGFSAEQFAACYVIPPMDQARASIKVDSTTANITLNRWLRAALKLAIGRDLRCSGRACNCKRW
jgi:hypothetical protein